MKKKIFISTPIAGFASEAEYLSYKKIMETICLHLQKKFGPNNIYAAFLSISDLNSYDSPEKSAQLDLRHLEASDYFILFYPLKIVTSALTELGIAIGMNKQILIIAPNIQTLPYMVQGLHLIKSQNIKFLSKNIDDEGLLNDIIAFLK